MHISGSWSICCSLGPPVPFLLGCFLAGCPSSFTGARSCFSPDSGLYISPCQTFDRTRGSYWLFSPVCPGPSKRWCIIQCINHSYQLCIICKPPENAKSYYTVLAPVSNSGFSHDWLASSWTSCRLISTLWTWSFSQISAYLTVCFIYTIHHLLVCEYDVGDSVESHSKVLCKSMLTAQSPFFLSYVWKWFLRFLALSPSQELRWDCPVCGPSFLYFLKIGVLLNILQSSQLMEVPNSGLTLTLASFLNLCVYLIRSHGVIYVQFQMFPNVILFLLEQRVCLPSSRLFCMSHGPAIAQSMLHQ